MEPTTATEIKPFDLETLDQTDTAVIQMVAPGTGDDIPGFTVEVYGQDSDVFKAETRKAENKLTEYSRRNRGKYMPAEMREELDRQKVIKCTKAIKGLVYRGEVITDPERAYTLPKYGWIFEQVSTGIMERQNFINGSSAK